LYEHDPQELDLGEDQLQVFMITVLVHAWKMNMRWIGCLYSVVHALIVCFAADALLRKLAFKSGSQGTRAWLGGLPGVQV
jgi:hypothetical protein